MTGCGHNTTTHIPAMNYSYKSVTNNNELMTSISQMSPTPNSILRSQATEENLESLDTILRQLPEKQTPSLTSCPNQIRSRARIAYQDIYDKSIPMMREIVHRNNAKFMTLQ